jgi:hypothetical protein
VVADPFELVGDVVEREQVAQIASHGLLGRDGHADEPRDLPLRIVDPGVGLDDVEGQLRIMARERLTGPADRFLDEGAHAQDGVLDLLFLQVERVTPRLRAGEPGLLLGGVQQFVDLAVHLDARSLGSARVVVSIAHPNRPDT